MCFCMCKGSKCMGIYKICSRCGKMVETGKECQCIKNRKAQSNKLYDKAMRNTESKNFYTSRKWRKCRENILESDGIDIYLYMTKGIVKAADTVHHIIPLQDNWGKRFQIENLMSLSAGTHSLIEKMYKKDKEKMIIELQNMVKDFRNKMKTNQIF